eukprot:GEMP01011595.1.p1 GENE.GEMP01011595.1~~GEMP01011595.1.p1  ORF type:complete len:324 (+),score=45.18 GEMP01011595.1:24-995(+)
MSVDHIWLEKYRPKTLDDVVGNNTYIQALRSMAADPARMSNLMLVGPPGVGKTTSIHALARTILGDAAKQAVLELNASDDRGLEVVRDKIKSFCRTKIHLPPGTFKILILDEVDSMTTNAQQALRTTMEQYSETTRFALACNESSKVLEPIQSRCAILRFNKVQPEDMKRRIIQIMHAENVSYDESGLNALTFVGNGDMRLAINSLQSVHIGFGHVSEANVYRVCDAPNPVAIEQAIAFCLKRDWKNAYGIFADLDDKGYNPEDVIGVLTRVIKSYAMREDIKYEFLREVCDLHGKAVQGFVSQFQFDALVSKLCTHVPANAN